MSSFLKKRVIDLHKASSGSKELKIFSFYTESDKQVTQIPMGESFYCAIIRETSRRVKV